MVGRAAVMRDLNLNLEDLFLPKCSLNILRKGFRFNQEYASLAQMSGLLRGKRTLMADRSIQTKGIRDESMKNRIFVVKRVKYAPSTRQESRILERSSKQDDKRDSLSNETVRFDHRLRYAVVRKVVERFEGDTTPLSQAFWKLCGMDFILIGGYGEMNHRFFCNQLAFDSQLYRALTLQTAEWWQTKLTDVWSKKMGIRTSDQRIQLENWNDCASAEIHH
ncbi:hypothetical protein PPACK8108_LOCUS22614 [Phakopsora pachyrhizi]|uniref:Uncharacterized protein n=1 Tax=Phakopsora pachyrhizi TaxID=170000 RepID=A0AAV0BQ98_PHAPC|nr:hypothetical protein PPACK8108_LOCUS22614 [Phakopsora pachyrhizi]